MADVRQILDLGWQCSFDNLYIILLNHYTCPFPVNGGHFFDKMFWFGKCNCQNLSITNRSCVKYDNRYSYTFPVSQSMYVLCLTSHVGELLLGRRKRNIKKPMGGLPNLRYLNLWRHQMKTWCHNCRWTAYWHGE